ncbi:hypothetical protein ACRE_044270 [Hapsidospora chrysogenum ATCC 11550]|uniref:Uncharacterized protein n=1 Tax=Hapsidospora chrysogenum (strain ATCC 11550 / CBS 779.69 / DSM 880 / IAM 14645 / JCM 23072 / IMI 49137) TaxID=857340 RepID=A0A086T642_HAPC1|nr:hypothetical protein ACRE_044270 [Hapsidospora chrysogenum ATCC 11550]
MRTGVLVLYGISRDPSTQASSGVWASHPACIFRAQVHDTIVDLQRSLSFWHSAPADNVCAHWPLCPSPQTSISQPSNEASSRT